MTIFDSRPKRSPEELRSWRWFGRDELRSFGHRSRAKQAGLDREDWDREILSHDELFIKLNDRIPREMVAIKDLTLSSLWRSPEHWEMTSDPT